MIRTFSAILIASSVCAVAQTATQKMVDMSVRVAGAIEQDGKMKPVSIGGGFILDSKHVVTTDACCGKTEDGHPKVALVVIGENVVPAQPVWQGPGYLVILELKDAVQSPAATLAPVKLALKNQPAYTVQFPKEGQPTVTEAKIQSAFTMENLKVQAYRAQPAPDSVLTGSAMYNACGQVMGINIGVKDGVQFAIVIDPVIAGLEKAGVQAPIANAECGGEQTSSADKGSDKGSPDKGRDKEKSKAKEKSEGDEGAEEAPAPSGWRLPKGGEWVGVGIIVVILAVALRSGTRQQVARVLTTRRDAGPQPYPYPQPQPYPQQYPQPQPQRPVAVTAPMARPKKPALHGIAGRYAGASVSLEGGPSMLGRDPASANLVFPPDADSVSKRHCTVRWDAGRGVFVLEDLGSTNGTFLANGERLAPSQPRDLYPGDKFYIGDMRNQFQVRMEE
jgi:hypothetical protein